MERLLLRAAPPAAAFTFVFGGGSAAAAAGSDLRRCALGGARRGCEATARSVRTPPGAAVPGAAVPGAPSGAAPRVIGAAVREIRFAPAGGAARAAALWHLGALRLLGPRPLRAVTVTFPVPFAPGGGGGAGRIGAAAVRVPPEGAAAAPGAHRAAFASRISEQRFLQEEPPVPAENIPEDVRPGGQRKARQPSLPLPR